MQSVWLRALKEYVGKPPISRSSPRNVWGTVLLLEGRINRRLIPSGWVVPHSHPCPQRARPRIGRHDSICLLDQLFS